jgi:hypothetical protein
MMCQVFYLFPSIFAFLLPWTSAFLQHRLALLDYTSRRSVPRKVLFASSGSFAPLHSGGALFLQVMIGPLIASLGSSSYLPNCDSEIGISMD